MSDDIYDAMEQVDLDQAMTERETDDLKQRIAKLEGERDDYKELFKLEHSKRNKAEDERDAAIELLREHRRQSALGGCSRNRNEIAAFLDELGLLASTTDAEREMLGYKNRVAELEQQIELYEIAMKENYKLLVLRESERNDARSRVSQLEKERDELTHLP